MKVLFVGPLPPPPGGGETVTQALLRSELSRRHQLVHCDTSRRLGVDRSGRLAAANWVNAGRQLARFMRLLATERPQLVHMPIAGNVSGLLRDRAFLLASAAWGVPVIGHVHGGTLVRLYRRPYRGTRTLVEAVFRGLDATIALSPSLARFFAENRLARDITVVSNPVDPDFLASLEAVRRAPCERSELEILFVGAVGHRKGVFDLVAALPGVLTAVPGARLRVVGPNAEPDAREDLRRFAQARGVSDRVAVDDPLYGRAKVEAFLAADLVALPSYDEQFPCVLLEAMAAGRPVISTEVGGIPDMVSHGEHGYVLSPGDGPALTAALVALADRTRREAMGRAAALHVRSEYRIETCVDRISALYERVVRGERTEVRSVTTCA